MFWTASQFARTIKLWLASIWNLWKCGKRSVWAPSWPLPKWGPTTIVWQQHCRTTQSISLNFTDFLSGELRPNQKREHGRYPKREGGWAPHTEKITLEFQRNCRWSGGKGKYRGKLGSYEVKMTYHPRINADNGWYYQFGPDHFFHWFTWAAHRSNTRKTNLCITWLIGKIQYIYIIETG
jgi:hypothetical protein